MDPILNKLYPSNMNDLTKDLISTYQNQGHAVVNFLYFANAMSYQLFERDNDKGRGAEKNAAYKQALLKSDFLLADGIALQLWSKWSAGKRVHNLNGTDLTPHLLDYLNENHKTSVYIYSLYDQRIGKGKEWLERAVEKLGKQYPELEFRFCHQSDYQQRGKDFPFQQAEDVLSRDAAAIRLFLNCTGTPFQELWVEEHRSFFEKNFFLVMNVGGFIDFAAGFEKRAPKRVVKARILETFRRVVTNPKKNLKKFLAMFGIRRIFLQKLRLKK